MVTGLEATKEISDAPVDLANELIVELFINDTQISRLVMSGCVNKHKRIAGDYGTSTISTGDVVDSTSKILKLVITAVRDTDDYNPSMFVRISIAKIGELNVSEVA
jgi:hypothetical protein